MRLEKMRLKEKTERRSVKEIIRQFQLYSKMKKESSGRRENWKIMKGKEKVNELRTCKKEGVGVEKKEEAAWRKEGQGQKGGCEGKRDLRKRGRLTGEMDF